MRNRFTGMEWSFAKTSGQVVVVVVAVVVIGANSF